MDWTQFATFLIANIIFTLTLWLWNRTESRADKRHNDAQIDAIRNLMYAFIQENKDFHGRLCAIEERNREKK